MKIEEKNYNEIFHFHFYIMVIDCWNVEVIFKTSNATENYILCLILNCEHITKFARMIGIVELWKLSDYNHIK